MNYQEAINQIQQLLDKPSSISLVELEGIIKSLTVIDTTAPEGAATHLYTRVKNYDFINSEVRAIDHTDLAKVLTSENADTGEKLFETALKWAIHNEDGDLTPTEVIAHAKDYLYGTSTNGTTGLWAEASRQFAAETTGDVVVHIGDINEAQGRTWWNVEMPLILNNENVTSINGVPKTQMLEMYNQIAASTSDANALENICRLVNDISPDNKQSDFLDGATLYYNDQGKVIGVDGSGITSGNFNRMPDDCAFSATIVEVRNFADDAKMAEVFGYDTYTNFTDLEKLQAKEIEYLTRQVTNLEGTPVDNHILNSYLAGSGKTIDQLDDMDRIAIRVSESLVNDSPSVPKLLNAAKKYEKLAKVGNVVGNVVDIAGTAFFIGKSIYDAQAAYDAGNENEAAGIVAGAATELKSDLLKVA